MVVLNKPLDNPNVFALPTIYGHLKSVYPFVACIIHDKDEDDNGNLKTIHIHAVLKTNRMRKATLINDLTELLGLPEQCISAEKIGKFRRAIRYLIHMDDGDKTDYLPFDILTNDQHIVDNCFVNQIEEVTEEDLINVVRYEKTTSKILIKIGKENYKKWASIIHDLQKELL